MLIYARYSTDEQNPRSIQDQVAYAKEILAMLGLTDIDIDIIVIYDEGISGEVVSRPGIDEVRAGIAERQFDIIFAEDSSRLFRHETACFELVERAVDEGIRVICWYDFVDTAEEDWDARLHDAQRQHAQSTRYTSRRIKRAHNALWEMGAAIGLPKPGYRRRPSVSATVRDPAHGPFFDEIDPEWESTAHEAFERIASGQSTRSVAQWLTSTGLPKTSNS
ncbi:MAG: recombinase family protein, partial [Planctomycetaceae bacterium]|nr:recombinase family protein [Planctomycetaceae bacterium]